MCIDSVLVCVTIKTDKTMFIGVMEQKEEDKMIDSTLMDLMIFGDDDLLDNELYSDMDDLDDDTVQQSDSGDDHRQQYNHNYVHEDDCYDDDRFDDFDYEGYIAEVREEYGNSRERHEDGGRHRQSGGGTRRWR